MDNNKFYKNIMNEINSAPVNEPSTGAADESVTETPELSVPYEEVTVPVINSAEEPSFWQKLTTTVSEGVVFGGLIMYLLIVVNLIGTAIFARKSGISLTQSVLYMFHIDTLSLDSFSFLEVSILVSYIFAFVFGGLLVFAFLRLAYHICKLCGFVYSNKVTRIILLSFMGIFLIASLILIIAGNNILSISVYNWAMPLLTFLGGFFMYCISLRDVNVY